MELAAKHSPMGYRGHHRRSILGTGDHVALVGGYATVRMYKIDVFPILQPPEERGPVLKSKAVPTDMGQLAVGLKPLYTAMDKS